MNTLLNIWNFISLKIIAKINWNWLKKLYNNGKYYDITDKELDAIRKILTTTNCIGLSRRKTHLTTYLIGLGSYLTTGKWDYWTHAFMNIEGDVTNDNDFILVEATAPGVHQSTFMEVFDCDSVCLLIPYNFTPEKWAAVVAKIPSEYGKKYDTLLQYKNDTKVDCIQLIRSLFMAEKNYLNDFAEFEALIQSKKQLTPQMLFDCSDFQEIIIIKH
jgi:hypothetical protein